VKLWVASRAGGRYVTVSTIGCWWRICPRPSAHTVQRTDVPFYRSLRAVKVLLAPLCSTLTVLAARGAGGDYRFTCRTVVLLISESEGSNP
jgi:hypothetical protein